MANIFSDFIFNQLPFFYRETDIQKNANGEGVLQRYLRTLETELGLELVPFIDSMGVLYDVMGVSDKFLINLSSNLGYMPSLRPNDPELYRKLLQFAVQIYKVKGTCLSFKILFNLLGLEVEILEDEPKPRITYDMTPPAIYDNYNKSEDIPDNRYDSECEYCTGFTLAVNSINDTCDPITTNPLTQSQLDAIENVICFLTPINATYKGIVQRIKVCDELRVTLQEGGVSVCSAPFDIVFNNTGAPSNYKIGWSGIAEYKYTVQIRKYGTIPWATTLYDQSPADGTFITIDPSFIWEIQIRHDCGVGGFSPWIIAFLIPGFGLVNQTGTTLGFIEIVASGAIEYNLGLTPSIVANGEIASFVEIVNGLYNTIDLNFTSSNIPNAGVLITNNGANTYTGFQYDVNTFRFINVTVVDNITINLT